MSISDINSLNLNDLDSLMENWTKFRIEIYTDGPENLQPALDEYIRKIEKERSQKRE